jgi:hypothetical protein
MQAFYTSIIIVFLKGLRFQDSIAVLNPWIEAAQSKTWPLSELLDPFRGKGWYVGTVPWAWLTVALSIPVHTQCTVWYGLNQN